MRRLPWNSAAAATAARPSAIPETRAGTRTRGEKAATNVRRYRARGTVQKSGIAAMSVVRYWVTPSRALDGTKARNAQRSDVDHAGTVRASTAEPTRGPGRRSARTPPVKTRTTTATNAADQTSV